jgi:cytochrome b6-f complex iron-sulfur subunit
MSTRPAESARSRLDPEPLPRRDFLGLAAVWSALAALGFATFGVVRLPRAAVVPMASRKFRITLPETLAPGEPYVPSGRPVAVFRDDQGVYALSTVCTHLGCIVKQEENGFQCPCHGSRFARDGEVIKGPAPKALAWLNVARVAPHTYMIDEGKSVPPGTRATA